ncbi:putative surface protein with fasciclin (FAS1) repeats [Aquimarina sp. MAR_2010_214]|uniref:fasciclin domain-containing protein n=1 Tax=Aquimarina sp. MAR_2010_214 TaxID=1250026 RepID=UPI000C712FE2|nr:fasciclin domain-containing protein [Aquimarina sp. MAR_2010_214]PKV52681.1 putative surface protein with fasciclin (FAS1) repeats [Aquimarina sp. MAR_2010_214]
MKIRNVLPVFALFSLLLTVACNDSKNGNTIQGQSDKLIAQTTTQSKIVEEKLPTILEFASMDKGFSTLTSAIKATELTKSLGNEGSYTIFAPVNLAFDKLRPGTVERLLKPENMEQLKTILNCHIIPNVITEEDIAIAIKEGNGSVKLKTIGGALLTATMKGDRVFLIDQMGNGGNLVTTDVKASNGLIHTIDAVMMPKK